MPFELSARFWLVKTDRQTISHTYIFSNTLVARSRTSRLATIGSGGHRAFDELSFGEFAQESSAFFGVQKLRK